MARTGLCVAFWIAAATAVAAEPAAKPDGRAYPLQAHLAPGARATVSATLDVGGDLIVPAAKADQQAVRLPLNVAGKLDYVEQLLSWPGDASEHPRSLRRYSQASAVIKTDERGVERKLPDDRRSVVAALGTQGVAMTSLAAPLTREQFDLINIVGNTLALDALLPNAELKEGEGWNHESAVLGALLGMDHVAVCDVRSVVTGEENRQVQIRLGGTVHGTVDGAATEMELRAAYLYHLDAGRITKFNLAIKERRKAGEVTPGLDVVAKLSIVAKPLASESPPTFDAETIQRAAALPESALRQLAVDAPGRGYRFQHDATWYVTAEERELMSLRLLVGGELLAHCNITSRPPRNEADADSLQSFESEVSQALGAKLQKVEAAREWQTLAGCRCLGVIANGSANEVDMQWRYYRLSGAGLPEATIAVTVEQSLLERFADADRALVDSFELVGTPTKTAAAPSQPPAKK